MGWLQQIWQQWRKTLLNGSHRECQCQRQRVSLGKFSGDIETDVEQRGAFLWDHVPRPTSQGDKNSGRESYEGAGHRHPFRLGHSREGAAHRSYQRAESWALCSVHMISRVFVFYLSPQKVTSLLVHDKPQSLSESQRLIGSRDSEKKQKAASGAEGAVTRSRVCENNGPASQKATSSFKNPFYFTGNEDFTNKFHIYDDVKPSTWHSKLSWLGWRVQGRSPMLKEKRNNKILLKSYPDGH